SPFMWGKGVNHIQDGTAEKQKAIREDGLLTWNLNGAGDRTRTDTSCNGGFLNQPHVLLINKLPTLKA
ncbi:hypothetical protein, partial [Aeromonas rivipollensis]|uniref:hypothetical protein n=1 Tax=Aeromonas rivipollensis TaxID=948519 RepID=UPI00373AE1AB